MSSRFPLWTLCCRLLGDAFMPIYSHDIQKSLSPHKGTSHTASSQKYEAPYYKILTASLWWICLPLMSHLLFPSPLFIYIGQYIQHSIAQHSTAPPTQLSLRQQCAAYNWNNDCCIHQRRQQHICHLHLVLIAAATADTPIRQSSISRQYPNVIKCDEGTK